MTIPYFDAATINRLLPPADAVTAIERALLNGLDPAAGVPRVPVSVPAGQLLLMPAASPASVGVKLATVAPANAARGLPTVNAVYVLFDGDTLGPVALFDGTALTTLRTPAVSVAAVRPHLPPRPLDVVIFGAGPQGRGHRDTLAAVAELSRVAVDGPPATGKTTLADELAAVLRDRGRSVIRATIDDFLFPRARRYPRGEYSAEGCYFDTHDYAALTRVLLDPLGPGGDRRFQPAVYDHATDAALAPPVATAPADAVLLFDGVFLLRPELLDRWDLRIFVSTDLETTVARAVVRERAVASRADVERRWRERYIPAQRLYFAAADPAGHADIVVHNDEPERPTWTTG